METATQTTEATRRLNINLPAAVYAELRDLSGRSGRSMTELVRLALGLAKVAIEEDARGHKILIGTSDGKILRQVIIPR